MVVAAVGKTWSSCLLYLVEVEVVNLWDHFLEMGEAAVSPDWACYLEVMASMIVFYVQVVAVDHLLFEQLLHSLQYLKFFVLFESDHLTVDLNPVSEVEVVEHLLIYLKILLLVEVVEVLQFYLVLVVEDPIDQVEVVGALLVEVALCWHL